MFAERDPLASPGGSRNGGKQSGLPLPQRITELGGNLSRQHLYRDEELSSSRLPVLTVTGDSAPGNQHVDVTVKQQLAVPSVQDRENSRHRSQMTFDRTEFLDSLGGYAHQ